MLEKKSAESFFNRAWLLKFTIPFFAFYVFFCSYLIFYPERTFESFILTLKYTREFLDKNPNENVKILIIGDSTIGAAISPTKISNESQSLITPGGNSRESYFTLKNFLKKNKDPKCILMNVSGNDDKLYYEKFWKAYLGHFYNFKNLNEIWLDSVLNNFHPADSQNKVEFFLEYILSKLNLLNFPWSAFLNSFHDSSFIKSHQELIVKLKMSKGQREYLQTNFLINKDVAYLLHDFEEFKLDDFYFKKILNLVSDRKIRLYYLKIPFEANIDPRIIKFQESSWNHKNEIGKESSFFEMIDSEKFERQYYSNINHFNKSGADLYSVKIKNKLSYECF